MKPMDLTTPAVMLSTISLLLLAFTNRFMGLASIARELNEKYQDCPEKPILSQLKNLRLRIRLIRDMQALGILSLFLFVLCMFLIFNHMTLLAQQAFGLGLILLLASLAYSIVEIYLSTRALDIALKNLESKP